MKRRKRMKKNFPPSPIDLFISPNNFFEEEDRDIYEKNFSSAAQSLTQKRSRFYPILPVAAHFVFLL